MPKQTATRRVLSRITQMTNLTLFTVQDSTGEVDLRPSALPAVAGAILIALSGLLVWWWVDTPEPKAPPPPPPIAEAPVETPTVAALPPPPPPPPPVVREPPKKRTKKRVKKKPGRLTLDTRPWTRVYLGRRLLGMTPLVNKKLPSGKHQLRLVNPELGLKKTITVTIRPGKTTRIQKTL